MGQNKANNPSANSYKETARNRSRFTNHNEILSKVFGNPLLLDKILEYIVCPHDEQQINIKRVYSMRCVAKLWLQSASRILPKYCTLFNSLSSDTDTSLNGVEYLNKKVMSDYILVFLEDVRVENSILPLRLEIGSHYFIKENYVILNKLFVNCRNLVIKLQVNFPPNGGSMKLKFDQLCLPNLRILEFSFDDSNNSLRFHTNGRLLGTNATLTGWNFLLQILKEIKQLKSFTLKTNSIFNAQHASSIGSLKLPVTLTQLGLKGRLSSIEQLILFTNKLPELNELNLEVFDSRKEDAHIIFQVLDRFKYQLKKFVFQTYFTYTPNDILCLRFPRMPKLTTLGLIGENMKMDLEIEQCWAALFPNLKCLHVKNSREPQILNFIDGKILATVTELHIFQFSFRHKISNKQFVEKIRMSLPNVQILNLCINFDDMYWLSYIFQYYINLKKLHICLHYANTHEGFVFASFLLGISKADTKTIRSKNEHKVHVPTDYSKSIMNLRDLGFLTLEIFEKSYATKCDDYLGMDSCKKYGFEKMPQLKTVKFLGGFKYAVLRCQKNNPRIKYCGSANSFLNNQNHI